MCMNCGPRLSRRGVMFGAAAVAASACLAPSVFAADHHAAPAGAPNAISGEEALGRLMAGNARYASNALECQNFSTRREQLVKGQFPIAAVIGCADSRVPPELCFDQGPGDLFVIRVAGNVIDNDGLASLEYGIEHLGIPLIIVLGHTGCGAVAAAVKAATTHEQFPGHLPGLIGNILPAVETAKARGGDLLSASVVANAEASAAQIRGSSPILAPAIAGGKVKLATGVYDLATGKVGLV